MQQQAFNMHYGDLEETFANYIQGKNAQVVNFLTHQFWLTPDSFAYLWGKHGSGKTHLLKAICQNALQCKKMVFYLDLSLLATLEPAVLKGLEKYDLVALDNIHGIERQSHWQEALFHLYNRIQENNKAFIISATMPPIHLNFTLADLISRLASGTILQLYPLNDQQKKQMLKVRAQALGIRLNQKICDYILTHYFRDTHQLMALLRKIDKQSLVEKRRITIPFLRSFFENSFQFDL